MMREFDKIDIDIINTYQKEVPLVSRPFYELAIRHKITEEEVLERIQDMHDKRVVTRFGPMFNIAKMGGKFSLCAMEVPEHQMNATVDFLNKLDEVAHNYLRQHKLNMWFVLACKSSELLLETIKRIEQETKITVYSFDKEKEFFVNLYLPILKEGKNV